LNNFLKQLRISRIDMQGALVGYGMIALVIMKLLGWTIDDHGGRGRQ